MLLSLAQITNTTIKTSSSRIHFCMILRLCKCAYVVVQVATSLNSRCQFQVPAQSHIASIVHVRLANENSAHKALHLPANLWEAHVLHHQQTVSQMLHVVVCSQCLLGFQSCAWHDVPCNKHLCERVFLPLFCSVVSHAMVLDSWRFMHCCTSLMYALDCSHFSYPPEHSDKRNV
jgi:hypothetical protein